MHSRPRSLLGQWLLGVLVTACQRPPAPPPPQDISSRDSVPAEPAFANLAWKVASGAETGAFYVFLGDGTLLMASAHGTPALGRWSHAGSDSLTLVEEGIAHPAAILRLDERELALRIFSPGPPVELTLVRAAPAMTPSGGSGADTLWGSAWVLEDIAGAGIIDDARATLEFTTAGKVAGRGSCNRFFGTVDVTGDRIRFSPFGATRMACPEAIMDQETRYFKQLQAAERFAIEGDVLRIYSGESTPALRFIRER